MSEDIIEEEINKSDGNKVIRRYKRGRLLGKGGFAKCFEITNVKNGKTMAAKIIDKSTLKKKRAKQKVILLLIFNF